MAGRDLISCIVPVFNGAAYLLEAIASIEAQTWRPLEIIIVDDGSTDETPAVIAALGDRVRSLRQDNAGPAAARNHGVEAALGNFIAFLDSDDEWLPEKLTAQMARFEARPELEMCLSQAEHWWLPELQQEAASMGPALNAASSAGWLPTALIRRGLFARAGMLDPTLKHMDSMEWLLRVRDVGGVSEILPEAYLRRRIHHNNLSRRRGGEDAEERLRIARTRMLAARRPR
jgi:glycosyltransferase involved in cell wall biosynthesis